VSGKLSVLRAKSRKRTDHNLIACLYRRLVKFPRLDLYAAIAAVTELNKQIFDLLAVNRARRLING
jgi:hypothetical protein